MTAAEFAAALAAIAGFEARPLLAAAVSGGADSMALVLLADGWVRERGGTLFALTVDHGLRPESADEARRVAGWLAARGIAHAILEWRGAKPATGIQAAAREARYRLLAGWCRAHGVLHVMTAHHREDQNETHLIRRRAGSGSDGLAGMSAVRELAGCRLVRPLLHVPRARLAALLAAERQPFVADPSNRDPRFERARLRLQPAAAGSIGTGIGALGEQRAARERAFDALAARAAALHPAGFAVVDPAVLAAAEPDAAERLLGRLALCIGGTDYPARRARLARLREALLTAPGRARTLGGCRFVPWRGRLLVMREPAAAQGPVRLDPGAHVPWDRRFVASLPAAAASDFILGYLRQGELPASSAASAWLPRLLDPVLPAFRDAQGLAAVPHLGYCRDGLGELPRLIFGAPNGLTTAGFTVV